MSDNIKCDNVDCGFRLCAGYEQLVCPYCTALFKMTNDKKITSEDVKKFDEIISNYRSHFWNYEAQLLYKISAYLNKMEQIG